MGADLYINPTHSKNYESLEPQWKAAIKRRNEVCAASKVLGTCTRNDFADTKGHSEACIKAQEKVDELDALMYSPETYFRDPYNCFSALNAYGLSWWVDVAKFQNKQGEISRRNAAKLIKLIEAHDKIVKTPDETVDTGNGKLHKTFGNAVFEGKKVSKRNWKQVAAYYAERREALLQFLKAYANSPSDGTVLEASL